MSDAQRIPIGNVFYLFCYAWNRFKEAAALRAEIEDAPDAPNMLARALRGAIDAMLARWLDRAYVERTEETPVIHGRLVMGPTAVLEARRTRRVVCEFSELEHDILANQILKATLWRLARVEDLDAPLRAELVARLRWFREVSNVRLHAGLFSRVPLHRNNAYYGLALAISELIHHCLLPTRASGAWRFVDVERDERLMARVFEDSLRNFWRAEQSGYRVSAPQLSWHARSANTPDLALVPSMFTDIVLQRPGLSVIVDAKYYLAPLQPGRGGDDKLISANLYQIYAYVKAMARAQTGEVQGMLVYPTTSRDLDLEYEIDGHAIHVRTVDLSRQWRAIHDRLLEIARITRPRAA